MVRRSVKKEFPPSDPVIIPEDEIPHVSRSSQQRYPSPSELPTAPDVEMEDLKESHLVEVLSTKGKLLSEKRLIACWPLILSVT